MPKSMVTAVGFSASTWLANRFAPPVAVSPPMPALMNVRSHFGNRVVRYSSMMLEYWYCSVMLSPRKTIRSPLLKKNGFSSADTRAAGNNSSRIAVVPDAARMIVFSHGHSCDCQAVSTGPRKAMQTILSRKTGASWAVRCVFINDRAPFTEGGTPERAGHRSGKESCKAPAGRNEPAGGMALAGGRNGEFWEKYAGIPDRFALRITCVPFD